MVLKDLTGIQIDDQTAELSLVARSLYHRLSEEEKAMLLSLLTESKLITKEPECVLKLCRIIGLKVMLAFDREIDRRSKERLDECLAKGFSDDGNRRAYEQLAKEYGDDGGD